MIFKVCIQKCETNFDYFLELLPRKRKAKGELQNPVKEKIVWEFSITGFYRVGKKEWDKLWELVVCRGVVSRTKFMCNVDNQTFVYVVSKNHVDWMTSVKMAEHQKLGYLILMHQGEGKTICVIVKLLKLTKSKVEQMLQRFWDTGTFLVNPKSGGPSSKSNRGPVDKARKKVIQSPYESARKIEKEHGMVVGTIRNVLKDDLGLCPFKYQHCQLISESRKLMWLEQGQIILEQLKLEPHFS